MEDRLDGGAVFGLNISGGFLGEKAGPDARFAVYGDFPAGDDLVKVCVAGKEDYETVGDEPGNSYDADSELIDHVGQVALLEGEVEVEATGSFG